MGPLEIPAHQYWKSSRAARSGPTRKLRASSGSADGCPLSRRNLSRVISIFGRRWPLSSVCLRLQARNHSLYI